MRSWLKEARQKSGFTMKQMGQKLGITESYYCTIESGERQKNMDISLVSGLSSALGIPIAEIARLEAQSDPTTTKDP